jgi:iron complex outermembrane receptor protein
VFDPGGFNNSTLGNNNIFALNDPRSMLPGMPLAVYAGIKARF